MKKNWCFVTVEEDLLLFIAQLVRRRTRLALEIIIHEFICSRSIILLAEYKSYHWLRKVTAKKDY